MAREPLSAFINLPQVRCWNWPLDPTIQRERVAGLFSGKRLISQRRAVLKSGDLSQAEFIIRRGVDADDERPISVLPIAAQSQ
jgi:hypothetical protein